MGRVKDMHLERVGGRWCICWVKRGSLDKTNWVQPCHVHIHTPDWMFRSWLAATWTISAEPIIRILSDSEQFMRSCPVHSTDLPSTKLGYFPFYMCVCIYIYIYIYTHTMLFTHPCHPTYINLLQCWPVSQPCC